MDMGYKVECVIDGKIFYGGYSGEQTRKLIKHLKNNYNLSYQEYVLEYFYEGRIPLCACGCGIETRFYKGIYRKYYQDHKNHLPPSKNSIKKSKISLKKRNAVENRLKRLRLSQEKVTSLYKDYVGFKKDSEQIHLETAVDFRTIKKLWVDLKLINDKESFRRITKRHQYHWANKNDKLGGKKHIEEEVLLNIYQILKKNKNKITIKEIVRKFDLPFTELVVYKRLKENFGEENIDELLKHGNSSRLEVEFYNVLKFFYGKKLSKQFKLEGKFYDYKLGDRILIEFDGDYWHSMDKSKKNDIEKNEIAVRNGYLIYRIKESESKNLVVLEKLNKIYLNEINQSNKASYKKGKYKKTIVCK